MAVSVRMEPLLEKQLEQAAKRKGMTKSQFIIDAVRHALGQKDPYALFLQVLAEENASSEEKSLEDEGFKGDLSDRDAKREYIQKKLRRKHGLDAG